MKINTNEVHLWYMRDEQINDNDFHEYRDFLNEEEKTQQKRFHFEKDRRQYLVARALVRSVLSFYIDTVPPQAWQFGKNEYNKPHVKNFPLPLNLSFNLSHTTGMVVLAVTQDRDIGVDVEFLQRNISLDIAKRYFSGTEFRDLYALPPQQQKKRFFSLWTLKEAYIKACGMGLAIPLNHFSYSFPRQGEVEISFDPDRNDSPPYWNLWQIEPDETHLVALAVRSPNVGERYQILMHEITLLKGVRKVNYPVVTRSH